MRAHPLGDQPASIAKIYMLPEEIRLFPGKLLRVLPEAYGLSRGEFWNLAFPDYVWGGWYLAFPGAEYHPHGYYSEFIQCAKSSYFTYSRRRRGWRRKNKEFRKTRSATQRFLDIDQKVTFYCLDNRPGVS